MANTPHHLFGNIFASIDVETTGLEAGYHEIVQIAVVPLDANLDPIRTILPFNMFIKPIFEERIDPTLQTKKLYQHAIDNGYPADTVLNLLEDWHAKLPLGYNANGKRYTLVPLGHNYCFDRSFLINLMGQGVYESMFHFHYRDTMTAGAYINDIYGMRGHDAPYSKLSLTQMCQKQGVEQYNAHNALDDCYAVAEVYKRMVTTHTMMVFPSV